MTAGSCSGKNLDAAAELVKIGVHVLGVFAQEIETAAVYTSSSTHRDRSTARTTLQQTSGFIQWQATR